MRLIRYVFLTLSIGALMVPAQTSIPHLRKQGTAKQLVVGSGPFLILGGELRNSSTSSVEYMEPLWERIAALNLNTVLAPITWELLEPEEGKFDFELVDAMIQGARQHNLKLVPLWFGTWKNGMSSYVPLWVKEDFRRFPRAVVQGQGAVEIITTLSEEACKADARAFAALMRHIREVDGHEYTVVMVQVQNEVGMLGDSRDRSAVANTAFAQPVPQKLVDYLRRHKDVLIPELRELWASANFRTSGSWEEVFGSGDYTDEVFMAWHYARYIDRVAAAGKAEYGLPMFANAWLSGSLYGAAAERPGHYPSGGPLPPVMDVWMAGAPSIDFLSPDIYQPNFEEWCNRYTQLGNPLFIPETRRDADGARNILFAFGRYETIGTSPFAIDDLDAEDNPPLLGTYAALNYLTPRILELQGRGRMAGFMINKSTPSYEVRIGDYYVRARLYQRAGVITSDDGFGIVLMTGEQEFYVAGSRALVTFRSATEPQVKIGIGPVTEHVMVDGKMVPRRRLNGDETWRGRAVRLPPDEVGVHSVRVYRYQ